MPVKGKIKMPLKKGNSPPYNKGGNPACRKKGVVPIVASREHIYIKASLFNDKGTWCVRARVPNPITGKTTQRSKSTGLKVSGNNKRKAEEKMREIVAEWEIEANTGVISGHNPPFAECVERWLEKKSLDIRPNTLQSYKVNADTFVIPAIGEIKVADLTRQHIQTYFNGLKDRVSVSTMKKHKVVIRGALEDAVLDGLVSVNVSDRVKLPKMQKFEGHALTENEVGRFLESVEHEREPIRAAVTLALVYGLRRSEICGLRWKDIDLDAGVLSVRNTFTEYSGKQFEAETTKSRASRRDIYLSGDTVGYLRGLQERQLSKGFALDKVCRHENGRTVKPEYLTRTIKAVLVKNGFENVRLHDLRHTAATMLARRLPVKQVQAFLGHEDVSTTLNIYTHITDADKISTAQTMSGILKGLKSCSEKCSESQNEGKTIPPVEHSKSV